AEPWLLETLPGIGEVLAQRIVDYRSENGPFKRIEDLLKVSGIGEATFEKIKDYITVSD
ncbi:MAG: helix-hairpin-helix domain-containing protein, partial [Dehalococcoidia bacterium]|nr:helix-hairpin-helix domain-containing protein [Dehalococcoidia bacterium]